MLRLWHDGSSPRVRGTPTPSRNASRIASVHPRVCGERRPAPGRQPGRRGSSPRVRGTHARARRRLLRDRFIPACAGNALANWLLDWLADGSSPRVRGTPRWRCGRTRKSPVHPRVCGERAVAAWNGLGAGRFIPACAGNAPAFRERRLAINGSSPRVRGTPWRPGSRVSCRPVHPRVCGERTSCNSLINNAYSGITLSTSKLGSGFVKEQAHGAGASLHSIGSGWWQEADELHAVQVRGYPTVNAAGVEIVASVVCGGPRDYGIALFDQGLHLLPDHLSGSPRIVANVHAGPDFEQPNGQSSAQSRRRVVNYDDQHRHWIPLGWLRVALRPVVPAAQVPLPPAFPQCWESTSSASQSCGNYPDNRAVPHQRDPLPRGVCLAGPRRPHGTQSAPRSRTCTRRQRRRRRIAACPCARNRWLARSQPPGSPPRRVRKGTLSLG